MTLRDTFDVPRGKRQALLEDIDPASPLCLTLITACLAQRRIRFLGQWWWVVGWHDQPPHARTFTLTGATAPREGYAPDVVLELDATGRLVSSAPSEESSKEETH